MLFIETVYGLQEQDQDRSSSPNGSEYSTDLSHCEIIEFCRSESAPGGADMPGGSQVTASKWISHIRFHKPITNFCYSSTKTEVNAFLPTKIREAEKLQLPPAVIHVFQIMKRQTLLE